MGAAEVFTVLARSGVTVSVCGGKIRAEPRERLTAALCDLIRTHEPALCAYTLSEVDRETLSERAAIMEFDGKLTRAEADWLAAESLGIGVEKHPREIDHGY